MEPPEPRQGTGRLQQGFDGGGRHAPNGRYWGLPAAARFTGVDVRDLGGVAAVFAAWRPAVVVNGTGLVKQRRQGRSVVEACAVNAVAPHRLADLCRLSGARFDAFGLAAGTADGGDVRLVPPFGFLDFVALESAALCVLSDSGTVQEECAILRTPNVTLRDTTERPETVECGSNLVSGVSCDAILRAAAVALALSPDWEPPEAYRRTNVSDTVVRIVLGHHDGIASPAGA